MADSMEVQKFEYVTGRVYGRAQVLEIKITQVTAWDEFGTADGVAVFRDTARGITGKCTNLFFMFKLVTRIARLSAVSCWRAMMPASTSTPEGKREPRMASIKASKQTKAVMANRPMVYRGSLIQDIMRSREEARQKVAELSMQLRTDYACLKYPSVRREVMRHRSFMMNVIKRRNQMLREFTSRGMMWG